MFFDTDCGGVVHNLAYLRMIEENRTRLARQLGMDLASMAKTQLFPVVVHTAIDYKKPAKLGDSIIIEGSIYKLQGVRMLCRFSLFSKNEGGLLASCHQQLALVQMPEGRPRRLPEEWKERFSWPD